MTVRFLEITPSSTDGFPFMPGQEIRLSGMTPEVRQWIRAGRAELVRDPDVETPTAAPDERAVIGRRQRRR